MADGPLSQVLEHLRRLAGAGEAADLEDRQLLTRFVGGHEEAAFETLLRRHGPMVLAVCRRILFAPEDVEDAFQATFLVLLRKAGSLRRRELLAPWLYGVAYRTALKARTQAARRRAHESRVPVKSTPPSESEVVWRDLRPVLDEELNRLPAKYRSPVVLCYLEGKTFTEAARQLGWPAGTVSGRLARARELLRRRLTRRGLALTAGALAACLPEEARSASVPAPLRLATRKAAIVLIAGRAGGAGLLPASVAALTEGVLHAMYWTQVKLTAALVLAVGVIATGAGLVTYQTLAAQLPGPRAAATPQSPSGPHLPKGPDSNKPEAAVKAAILSADQVKALLARARISDRMNTLLKERYQAAATEVEMRWREVQVKGTFEMLSGASQRLLHAELGLSDRTSDQIAAWERHIKLLKWIEEANEKLSKVEPGAITNLAESRFNRLDAEISLERVKERAARRVGD